MSDSYRILARVGADSRMDRQNLIVTIANGSIVELGTWNDATRPQSGDIDARDLMLLPGFVDIHIHGGAGRYVMEGTPDALHAIAQHLARHGVTGWLPTTVTAPWDEQRAVLDAAAQLSPEDGTGGAQIWGVHLEGPYINPKKKGAQAEQHIRLPDITEFQQAVGSLYTLVSIVTVAPEMPGALEFIRFLASQNIMASLGHTDATYAQISDAIDAGARHVTHCFNAMRPMDSREPGTVGAAFARSELMAELIWDNIHVHPASCEALLAAKRAEGVILISDGIPGAGMPDGYEFTLGDLPIKTQNGRATLPDGTLAGSLLTLDKAFANAAGFSLSQRAALTSGNAIQALGMASRYGRLAPGFQADLVLLDLGGKVHRTLIHGETAYCLNSD